MKFAYGAFWWVVAKWILEMAISIAGLTMYEVLLWSILEIIGMFLRCGGSNDEEEVLP